MADSKKTAGIFLEIGKVMAYNEKRKEEEYEPFCDPKSAFGPEI